MKRNISESEKVEKVQMETKIEDVPDDSESRDQIRINLVIKSEQITEVFFKVFFLCQILNFQFRTFCTRNQLNVGGVWKILLGCPYGSHFGPHFTSSLTRFM